MAANLAELKRSHAVDAAANLPVAFNPDAWHAMQARDDALIEDSILHGYAGEEYVYQFKIQNTTVNGVSVVGARALAAEYGGIKSRIVASVDKTGSLFVFKSFEPLAIQAQLIPQLAEQDDFYEVVVEVTDIKTGNSIQVRKKETKTERRRDGSAYDRPHFDVIAESKGFRNGVLSIIPQRVIKEFKDRCLRGGKSGNEKTIDQLRDGALAFAAKNAISLDRRALEDLTYSQIFGLGNAAKDIGAFREAAESLRVVMQRTAIEASPPPPSDPPAAKPARGAKSPAPTEQAITSQIRAASTVDEVNAARDLIRSLDDDAAAQARLNGIADDRLEQLENA